MQDVTVIPFLGSYNNGGIDGYYYMNWINSYSAYGDGLNLYFNSIVFADDDINIYGVMRSYSINYMLLSYIYGKNGTIKNTV